MQTNAYFLYSQIKIIWENYLFADRLTKMVNLLKHSSLSSISFNSET